jgi:hypothetical protein
MRFFLPSLLLLASAPAAWAATDPCAKYTDADAYNYCLAGFGPTAGHRTFSKAPPQAEEAAEPPRRASRSSHHFAAPSTPARRLPSGMIQKAAPKGRVHFQIIVR